MLAYNSTQHYMKYKYVSYSWNIFKFTVFTTNVIILHVIFCLSVRQFFFFLFCQLLYLKSFPIKKLTAFSLALQGRRDGSVWMIQHIFSQKLLQLLCLFFQWLHGKQQQ